MEGIPPPAHGILIDGWAASGPVRVRLEYEADDPAAAGARAAIAAFEAAGPSDADREELVLMVAARVRAVVRDATSFLAARAGTIVEERRRAEAARNAAAGKAKAKAARAAARRA